MRILRWMYRVTRKDTIRNENIPGITIVTQASKTDHREKIELERSCDEKRRRTPTEESNESGYSWEKDERTTENKMERRVSTRLEKYWRGDEHGDVE